MSSRATNAQPLATTTVQKSESVSVTVCEVVSRVSETSIRELPPLGRTVDPDALDAVFQQDVSYGVLSFQYAGYDVSIRSDGTIEVYREATITG